MPEEGVQSPNASVRKPNINKQPKPGAQRGFKAFWRQMPWVNKGDAHQSLQSLAEVDVDTDREPSAPKIIRSSGPIGISQPVIIRESEPIRTDVTKQSELTQEDLTTIEVSELEALKRQQEVGLQQRLHNILTYVPDSILTPQSPTFTHRTIEENALNILRTGLIADTGLQTTISGLSPATEVDKETRIKNAHELARLHFGSEFAVILQFPREMPSDARQRLEQFPDDEQSGIRRYNAYLKTIVKPNDPSDISEILPTQYIIGVVNQNTGKYSTREEFIAAHL